MPTQFKRRRRPGRFAGQKYPTHAAVGLTIEGVFAPLGTSTTIQVVWSTEVNAPPSTIPPGWLIDSQTPLSIQVVGPTLWILTFTNPIGNGATYDLPANQNVTNLAGQQWTGQAGNVV